MKEYIFDEKAYIEKIINANSVDMSNPTNTIRQLARYNYHVRGLTKGKNYAAIVDYMSMNYKGFSEISYQKSIDGCIRDVKKTAFKNIAPVVITQKELDIISSLDDIKKQKLVFVLLCTAKYRDQYIPNNQHKTDISTTDLYKRARVVLPCAKRDIYLHFLVTEGLVERHTIPDTKNKKLIFVDEEEHDVVMSLTEPDFKDLAYVYMAWKNGGKGFTKCQKCGITIKQSKTKPRKYCDKCAEYEPVGRKTVICIDCGKELVVDATSRICRCECCDNIHQKLRNSAKVKAYRERKSVTDLVKKSTVQN